MTDKELLITALNQMGTIDFHSFLDDGSRHISKKGDIVEPTKESLRNSSKYSVVSIASNYDREFEFYFDKDGKYTGSR